MTHKEKVILYKVERALSAVRGVENPMDYASFARYYNDMEVVISACMKVMYAMRDPEFPKDLTESMEGLRRRMQRIGEAGNLLYNGGEWWLLQRKRAQ